jgi:hypothetical protein
MIVNHQALRPGFYASIRPQSTPQHSPFALLKALEHAPYKSLVGPAHSALSYSPSAPIL